uniref:Uncharacterized protein n=1 Tax=Anguilla anguilla TaxID=7936 RepID=A0A0E9PIK3_ANGAN
MNMCLQKMYQMVQIGLRS